MGTVYIKIRYKLNSDLNNCDHLAILFNMNKYLYDSREGDYFYVMETPFR